MRNASERRGCTAQHGVSMCAHRCQAVCTQWWPPTRHPPTALEGAYGLVLATDEHLSYVLPVRALTLPQKSLPLGGSVLVPSSEAHPPSRLGSGLCVVQGQPSPLGDGGGLPFSESGCLLQLDPLPCPRLGGDRCRAGGLVVSPIFVFFVYSLTLVYRWIASLAEPLSPPPWE